MAGDEFEDDEAEAGAECAAGVKEPEGRREPGEEGEAHRQEMSEGDAGQEIKRDGPEEADLCPNTGGRNGATHREIYFFQCRRTRCSGVAVE